MDSAPPPLRTLIVDDEPLGVERLQILCASEPRVALVGTAPDGEAALRLVDALAPDLILCDIAMPGLDGIGVARALQQRPDPPAIIFTTAFDAFAVSAFDVAAVDYLLKPIARERLSLAIGRVRPRQAAPAPAVPPSEWLQELWVPHHAEIIRIATADIERIEAERDYMRLHLGSRSFLIHRTMSDLAARLDPELFVRLHRSTIVRRDLLRALRHDGAGSWHAELVCGDSVRIGRSFLPAVKAMMEASG
jgi:two-component system response regulator AlgR